MSRSDDEIVTGLKRISLFESLTKWVFDTAFDSSINNENDTQIKEDNIDPEKDNFKIDPVIPCTIQEHANISAECDDINHEFIDFHETEDRSRCNSMYTDDDEPTDYNNSSSGNVPNKKKKKKKKKPHKTKKKLSWGSVDVVYFGRDLSFDAVPSNGSYPLGLGKEESRNSYKVEDFDLLRQADLLVRAQSIPGFRVTHPNLETRQFDYKADSKNPLFQSTAEVDRLVIIYIYN